MFLFVIAFLPFLMGSPLSASLETEWSSLIQNRSPNFPHHIEALKQFFHAHEEELEEDELTDEAFIIKRKWAQEALETLRGTYHQILSYKKPENLVQYYSSEKRIPYLFLMRKISKSIIGHGLFEKIFQAPFPKPIDENTLRHWQGLNLCIMMLNYESEYGWGDKEALIKAVLKDFQEFIRLVSSQDRLLYEKITTYLLDNDGNLILKVADLKSYYNQHFDQVYGDTLADRELED